jgi:hypothetical protein
VKAKAWDRSVQGIEGFRLEHGVKDTRSAFGAEPHDAAARMAREAARRRLAEAQRRLDFEQQLAKVEVDTLRWRLNRAQAAKSIGDQQYGLGAEANGVFVIIELSVKNNKSGSVTLTSEVASLVAGDKTYSTDSNAETALIGSGDKTFLLDRIQPESTGLG